MPPRIIRNKRSANEARIECVLINDQDDELDLESEVMKFENVVPHAAGGAKERAGYQSTQAEGIDD